MNLPDKCKEFFLEGITDAYLYSVNGSSMPLPFSLPQILVMNNCVFPDALLHITIDGEAEVVADSLSVKSTMSAKGNGKVFSFEMSASINDGKQIVRETQRKIFIEDEDYYLVLKSQDGLFHLCYTLPGTFTFSANTSFSQSNEQLSLSISMKSMSDFIPIKIM